MTRSQLTILNTDLPPPWMDPATSPTTRSSWETLQNRCELRWCRPSLPSGPDVILVHLDLLGADWHAEGLRGYCVIPPKLDKVLEGEVHLSTAGEINKELNHSITQCLILAS